MKSEPPGPGPSPRFWAILGVCAGVGSLLYLQHHRRKSSVAEIDAILTQKPVKGPLPKPGDILLFHNARGLNKIIARFTGSQFYHAALYAGDGWIIEARMPGVIRQNLRSRKGDFVIASAPDGAGELALNWAKEQIGDSYDNLGIAVIVLNRLSRLFNFKQASPGKYSCGEFIAAAFEKAGANLFPERSAVEIVPGDFARFLPAATRRTAK